MSEKTVVVWDGRDFLQMPENLAQKERDADRVQIVDRMMAGTEFKYRRDFTGYQIKAESVTPVVAEESEEEVEEEEAPKPKTKRTKKEK